MQRRSGRRREARYKSSTYRRLATPQEERPVRPSRSLLRLSLVLEGQGRERTARDRWRSHRRSSHTKCIGSRSRHPRWRRLQDRDATNPELLPTRAHSADTRRNQSTPPSHDRTLVVHLLRAATRIANLLSRPPRPRMRKVSFLGQSLVQDISYLVRPRQLPAKSRVFLLHQAGLEARRTCHRCSLLRSCLAKAATSAAPRLVASLTACSVAAALVGGLSRLKRVWCSQRRGTADILL